MMTNFKGTVNNKRINNISSNDEKGSVMKSLKDIVRECKKTSVEKEKYHKF